MIGPVRHTSAQSEASTLPGMASLLHVTVLQLLNRYDYFETIQVRIYKTLQYIWPSMEQPCLSRHPSEHPGVGQSRAGAVILPPLRLHYAVHEKDVAMAGS